MARFDGSLTMIWADHPVEHGKNALTNRIISTSSCTIYRFSSGVSVPLGTGFYNFEQTFHIDKQCKNHFILPRDRKAVLGGIDA
jgi:hypothetical protein